MSAENAAWKDTTLRSSKYLNNMIEQDPRDVKLRMGPMQGFKNVDGAAVSMAGIELLHKIRKAQFSLGRFRMQGQAASHVWNAVLAA